MHDRHSRQLGRRPQRYLVALLATVLLAGLTTVLTPTPAHAVSRWAGYTIKAGRTADDSWIGGYKLNTTRLYQYQPNALRNTKGYRAGITVVTGRLNSRTTRAEVQRAAYVLSRFGAYPSAAQAAAVDAAVYHYAWGGTLAWNGTRGAQRIRQTGSKAAQVRSLTRQIVATANLHAGPVRVGVHAPNTTVGGYVTVTVTVADGGGYRMANTKVRAAFRGRTMDGTTNSRGQAQFQFPATVGGTATVTGAALGVPSHYLQVKRAKSSRQANAIIAGRKLNIGRSTTVRISGNQTLSVASTASIVTNRQTSTVRFTVNGLGGSQTATTDTFGPFSSPSAASCTGTVRVRRTQTITGNGTFTAPAAPALATAGYYKRRVTLSGNSLNNPVSTCGALFTNRAVVTASYRRVGEITRTLGSTISARVGLAGLPNTNPVSVGIFAYGPFSSSAAATCTSSKQNRAWVLTFRGNTTVDAPAWKPTQRGVYVVQVSVPGTELTMSAKSPCGGSNAFVLIK